MDGTQPGSFVQPTPPPPPRAATQTRSARSRRWTAVLLLAALLSACASGPSFSPHAHDPLHVKRDRLIALAQAEWVRWGRPYIDLTPEGRQCRIEPDGRCVVVQDGCGAEQSGALCPVVDSYWQVLARVSRSDYRHDCSLTDVCQATRPEGFVPVRTPAWSAGFISALHVQAGHTPGEFHASANHADYIVAARDGRTLGYTVAPTPAALRPGDLVCATRFADRPQYGPDDVARIEPHRWLAHATPMHCDLVVSVNVRRAEAQAIGGNVQQAVAMTSLQLDREGRLPSAPQAPGRRWMLVLKSNAAPAIAELGLP